MRDWKSYLDPRFEKGIAHRGLHDAEKTENGLKAFKAAIDIDSAFEFDIHLTKDGKFVVVHDSELKRVTGREGIVEELTLEQVKRDYRLLDGEEIPTLDEVLALNDGKVPMVIELKAYGKPKDIRRLGKEAGAYLKGKVDPRRAMIISFDPRALWGFGKKDGYHRSLLVCLEKKWTLMFRHCFDSIDVEDRILLDKKVVAFRKSGRLINVWTIRSAQAKKDVAPYADLITYENFTFKD